jgi:hypothetical protein
MPPKPERLRDEKIKGEAKDEHRHRQSEGGAYRAASAR